MNLLHEDVARAVAAADETRIAATLTRDGRTLDEVLAADLRYVHSSGADEDKPLYMKRVLSGHYAYRLNEVQSREVVFPTKDIALVNGDTFIDIDVQGEFRSLAGRFMQVWVFRKDRWQLLRFHAAPIPRPTGGSAI
jgi:hypothetical protein